MTRYANNIDEQPEVQPRKKWKRTSAVPFHGTARTLHVLFILRERGRARAVSGRIGNELLIYLSSFAWTLVGKTVKKEKRSLLFVFVQTETKLQRLSRAHFLWQEKRIESTRKFICAVIVGAATTPRVQLAN